MGKKENKQPNDRRIAHELGMKPPQFANLKSAATSGGRQLPLRQITEWAIKNNYPLEELLTGVSPCGEPDFGFYPPRGDPPLTGEEKETLKAALNVLRASDVPGGLDKLLRDTIKNFSDGVEAQRKRPGPRHRKAATK